MQLAASPEAFLTLRSHFVHTIASVSSCQYVMGIGDRHLSNFMVDLESGGIVGIDFGHNFGTATQVMPHSDSAKGEMLLKELNPLRRVSTQLELSVNC